MTKPKNRLQQVIVVTLLLALTFVIGRIGSLEVGNITTGQAAGSCLIGVGYMAVAVITYIIVGKEEEL
jgi:hypothetical protein